MSDDVKALRDRLCRINAACGDMHPKQAVGEMIVAMLDMPQWDRIEVLQAEAQRLTQQRDDALAERQAIAATLPGVYYMDPPDGGDVSLLKQLQRMSNDAARYRLLRRKFAIISDGEGNAEFCPINLPRPTYIAPNSAIELDTALDRERLGLDGANVCESTDLCGDPFDGCECIAERDALQAELRRVCAERDEALDQVSRLRKAAKE